MPRYALRFGGPVLLPDLVIPPANITLYMRGKGAPNAARVNIVSIDYFSPVFVGDIGNPLCIQVLHKDGSIVSILGATVSMELQSVTNPATIKVCTAPWVIDPADTGKAFYPYRSGDIDTADSWKLWIKIFIKGEPIHLDDGAGSPKVLVIEPLPLGV